MKFMILDKTPSVSGSGLGSVTLTASAASTSDSYLYLDDYLDKTFLADYFLRRT